MCLRSPQDLCPFCIASATTSKQPLHLISLFFICSSHNPQPPSPFSPSNEKKRMEKKQQQPLLPVKLLVAPLTALTGESKAIKMTRRQIVCDTSKGLEKAGKLSSATSSSTLRREREEKKKKITQSRQARAAWSTQAPRDSRALLSASPQTQTQTRPPRLHVQ